jgi:hypothetical protein
MKHVFGIILYALVITMVNAQYNYVDIEPDIRFEDVHYLNLDLDKNGSVDFRLFHDTSLANWPNEGSQLNCIHHMGINEIVGQEAGHFYPKPLQFNTYLFDGSKSWGMHEDNLCLYAWVITDGRLSHHGLWRNLTNDRFVGFRMQTDNGPVYGWIRLFVSPDGKYMILKDYAYMEEPNLPMYTGQGIPVKEINKLEVSDVFDFGDGRDLQISFNKAENELALSHYRVLVIKSSVSSSFNLDMAMNVAVENVTKIYPSNNNKYSIFLNENSKDVDGDLIKSGESYVVKVLSKGRLMEETPYALSAPSEEFTLEKLSGITETVDENIRIVVNQKRCKINSTLKIKNIQLWSVKGQLVLNNTCNANQYQINMDQYGSGIYYVKIFTQDAVLNRKIYITQ